ncbi:MAG TPA: DNA translocase FtsK 4TM domain-containing protein, partial [Longimicrobiales bacterium]|nr:DNA translocase FtsK 4TM domain-containing protein [Longimicrobiales bacterium]
MAARSSRKGSARKGKSPSGGGIPFLTREQERDILGICFLVLAAFLLLSLVPVTWFGARGAAWFPSGNLVGTLGGAAQGLQRALVGGAAPLIPALLVVAGLWSGEWISRGRAVRLAILVLGLLLVVPILLQIWVEGPEPGGWIGSSVGAPLDGAVGWLGATLLAVAAMVALSVGTLGWNPLRTLAGGLARGGEAAREAAARMAARAREQEAARQAEAALVPEEWTGPETGEEEPAAAVSVPQSQPAPLSLAGVESPPKKARKGARSDSADDLPDPADPRDLLGGDLPPGDILTLEDGSDRADMERELDGLGEVLVEKLRTFNVECSLGGRTTGPVVTQFEVVPAPGVK